MGCISNCTCGRHKHVGNLCLSGCTCKRHQNGSKPLLPGEKRLWTPWPKGKKRGPQSPEHRAKNGDVRRGKPIHSPEQRKKISERCYYSFTGGQAAVEFAKVLLPAGYVREVHVPWGTGHNERFVLDFAHLEAKVDIELDGASHRKTQEYDCLRDILLKQLGWKVIRIKLWT